MNVTLTEGLRADVETLWDYNHMGHERRPPSADFRAARPVHYREHALELGIPADAILTITDSTLFLGPHRW